VGAALIYTSTAPENESNMRVLKKYIEHRLYPENLLIQDQQGELAMEVSSSSNYLFQEVIYREACQYFEYDNIAWNIYYYYFHY